MQFNSLILALSGTTLLMAHPFTERDNGFIELDRQPASHGSGHLVFLGSGENTKRMNMDERNPIEERASCTNDPTPSCSGDHTARNDICDKLVTELFADPTISVGSSPRQICYEGDAAESNEYCCVSWHNVVDGLTKGDLAPIAQTIEQQCTQNGISGKTNNVWVFNTCTSVCLSNRGTHC
ncbi:Uu.00g090820.m01.CDS01 [Anthostomella pinea]|uniref:Uu.00g090820.m01.CDS01 n=1 Tax=Anthostomella pinea TaxID=933095 RepID=A0AAI8VMX4_9PEZI|nr:Uu.00g090820.m01.CDS01 [Anthostomella pinea]